MARRLAYARLYWLTLLAETLITASLHYDCCIPGLVASVQASRSENGDTLLFILSLSLWLDALCVVFFVLSYPTPCCVCVCVCAGKLLWLTRQARGSRGALSRSRRFSYCCPACEPFPRIIAARKIIPHKPARWVWSSGGGTTHVWPQSHHGRNLANRVCTPQAPIFRYSFLLAPPEEPLEYSSSGR